jgi:hypothetical protein
MDNPSISSEGQIEPLPCPFCGKEFIRLRMFHSQHWSVECNDTDCLHSGVRVVVQGLSRDGAVETWNKRANSLPQGEEASVLLPMPVACGVCLGQSLASGRECICKGVGTEQAETQGLRELAFELEGELAALKSGPYKARACRGHFHVSCDGMDVMGHVDGTMDEAAAIAEAERQNAEWNLSKSKLEDDLQTATTRIASIEKELAASLSVPPGEGAKFDAQTAKNIVNAITRMVGHRPWPVDYHTLRELADRLPSWVAHSSSSVPCEMPTNCVECSGPVRNGGFCPRCDDPADEYAPFVADWRAALVNASIQLGKRPPLDTDQAERLRKQLMSLCEALPLLAKTGGQSSLGEGTDTDRLNWLDKNPNAVWWKPDQVGEGSAWREAIDNPGLNRASLREAIDRSRSAPPTSPEPKQRLQDALDTLGVGRGCADRSQCTAPFQCADGCKFAAPPTRDKDNGN